LRAILPEEPAEVIAWMLARRQVKRGGARLSPTDVVCAGDALVCYLPKAALRRGEKARIPVLYEDARVLVAVKPQGLASRGADDPKGAPGTLELVARQTGCEGLRLCHRLDHNTGGVLLLAKDAQAEDALRRAFARHDVQKTYACLVVGTPQPAQATLRAYLRKDARAARVMVTDAPAPGALPIETGYRVLRAGEIALLEVRLVTGRTHQIRAHLAHVGHPVLGDDKYGDRAANRARGLRRQQLWATGLTLCPGPPLAYLDGRAFCARAPFMDYSG
jgi:23S rRNA pseudouridine955/2504/2580 synthase